jgi:hypothetical protein
MDLDGSARRLSASVWEAAVGIPANDRLKLAPDRPRFGGGSIFIHRHVVKVDLGIE